MLNPIGARYDNSKAKSIEHVANNVSTVASMGILATTPYIVKKIITSNPGKVRRAEYCTGKGIEKTEAYIKNLMKDKNIKKITSFISNVSNKIKNLSIVKNITKNKTIQDLNTKISGKLRRFENASKLTKGKYALITAGVSLLAYTAFKTITNHYKKEGAIDQKYKDMEVMNTLLA